MGLRDSFKRSEKVRLVCTHRDDSRRPKLLDQDGDGTVFLRSKVSKSAPESGRWWPMVASCMNANEKHPTLTGETGILLRIIL